MLQVVTDRGFRHGDVAVVDFAASAAGAEIPGLTRPKMRIDSNEPEQLPGERSNVLTGHRAQALRCTEMHCSLMAAVALLLEASIRMQWQADLCCQPR